MKLKESLDAIKKYCKDRPEINAIGMIDPPVDSISTAIQQKILYYLKAVLYYLLPPVTIVTKQQAIDLML